MAAEQRQSARRPAAGDWFAGGLIVLLGAALRFFRVGEQIVIDDEWHALNVVQDQGFHFIFSHFGHADHSIPMALYLELLSRTVGLGEWGMRLPSLLAGTMLIPLLPWLLRRWLRRDEQILTAALLAIAPLLIYFSRIARPYALLALLSSASLPLAWRWWTGHSRLAGVAWFACTVLAGWLSPVSLALTTAPFLWFAAAALTAGFRERAWRGLLRLVVMGLLMASSLFALLYVPVTNDFASLAIKSGLHGIDLGSLNVMLSLYSGSGHQAIVLLVAAAALAGLLVLRARDAHFARFLVIVALAAGLAIAFTGAEWLIHGLVPARYLVGLLPLYLALTAIGLATLAGRLQRFFHWTVPARHGFLGLLVLLLIAAGPLRDWDLTASRFVHHLARQLDYRQARNPILQLHETYAVPAYYSDIARLHPQGDAVIVEAPWYLESFWNTLYLSEQTHGQRVVIGFIGGACAGDLYGELHPGAEGMAFRNFVRLDDVLAGRAPADYLVLRRRSIAGARLIDASLEDCETEARKQLGAPWRDSPEGLVFRLNPGS